MAGRTSFLGGGVLLGVLIVALGVHYGATGPVAAAEMERTVHLGTAVKMQPVAIVKVALGPSTVQLGRWDKPARETPDPDTPFTGDDNWLQELTVYVLNRTDRPIAFLTLQLDFRETTVGPMRTMCWLHWGVWPASTAFDGQGNPMPPNTLYGPIDFGPGQILAVHLADRIDQIKGAVENALPLAAVGVVNVRPVEAVFADGLRFGGLYQVFDPTTRAWRSMNRDYFPGNPDNRWPGRPGWTNPH